MIGTLIATLLAFFLWQHPFSSETMPSVSLETLMIAVSILTLFFIPIGFLVALGALQRAENKITPRIIEIFRKDFRIHLLTAWIVLFSLTTLVAALGGFTNYFNDKIWLWIIWIICLGITIDALRQFSQRLISYANPFAVIKMYFHEAERSIQNDREIDLCNWIDALSEVAVKGIHRYSTALCNRALEEEQNIAREFLEASKSIGHPSEDKETKALGIHDKVNYTMFYLYQRLDQIFEQALRNKLDTTCSLIISLMGKISVDAAKYDVSLASAPLRFLGKFAARAQTQALEETTLTASCTFLEVAKIILQDIDITYYEIKDPFLSIINGMEILAKETFRKDKSTNIALLIQPFKELKSLFENDKIKQHQDTPIIVQNIDRVLGEFEALQMVMNTMPIISNIPEETPMSTK